MEQAKRKVANAFVLWCKENGQRFAEHTLQFSSSSSFEPVINIHCLAEAVKPTLFMEGSIREGGCRWWKYGVL